MLINNRPTYLITIARKINQVEVFKTSPQQSDYVVQWSDGVPAPERQSTKRWLIDTVRRFVSDDFEQGIRPRFAYKAYRPVSRDALMRGQV